ncbi:sensor histidine kinase [Deinococcus enclensis]|uniref:histidine kinase n=1 Tax=Deinococcus enclensis TaxID=1049582 RepID=A0ABT9MF83_9DEIO|nr:sensor histidine kinase [Deinococcus enclensis]MDP9765260.1 signal transduction histidine kinase [Deinococcus enclensis]
MTRFFQRLDTRARATALFTGLGLAYNLLQSLVMPAEWEYSKLESTQDVGTLWPLLQPAGVLVRVGVTLAAGALLLWGLRPCPRRRGEGWVLGLGLGAYGLLVSLAYPPVSLLMVLPPVLRYWWPLRRTLLVALGLTLALPAAWFGLATLQIPTLTMDVQTLVTLLVLTLSQGGFAIAAFELTLRRDEERAELRRALAELRQYHGLELQHAALEERTRISRELHDTLGHELTALRLELQRGKRLLDQPEGLRDSLGRALARSNESMQSLQAAVRTLRPHVPDGTLYGAVQQLLRAWPVPVELRCSAPEPAELSPQLRLAAFRTIQEALTNALKHAPGQEVTVELHPCAQGLTLRVVNGMAAEENGDALPADSGGHGVTGLQERLSELGGTLHVSHLDGRFELRAEFPLHPAGAARLEAK